MITSNKSYNKIHLPVANPLRPPCLKPRPRLTTPSLVMTNGSPRRHSWPWQRQRLGMPGKPRTLAMESGFMDDLWDIYSVCIIYIISILYIYTYIYIHNTYIYIYIIYTYTCRININIDIDMNMNKRINTLVGQKLRLLSFPQWKCLVSSSAHPFPVES